MNVSIAYPNRLAGAVGHVDRTLRPYLYLHISVESADPRTLAAYGDQIDDQTFGVWVLKGDTMPQNFGSFKEICLEFQHQRPGVWCGEAYVASQGQDRLEAAHMRCTIKHTLELDGEQVIYRGAIWTKNMLFDIAYAVLVPDTLLHPIIDAIHIDGAWKIKERP